MQLNREQIQPFNQAYKEHKPAPARKNKLIGMARCVGRKRKAPALPPLKALEKAKNCAKNQDSAKDPASIAISPSALQAKDYLTNLYTAGKFLDPQKEKQEFNAKDWAKLHNQSFGRFLALQALAFELWFAADKPALKGKSWLSLAQDFNAENKEFSQPYGIISQILSLYKAQDQPQQASLAKARVRLWAKLLGHNALDMIANLALWDKALPASAWPQLRRKLDLAQAILALSNPALNHNNAPSIKNQPAQTQKSEVQ